MNKQSILFVCTENICRSPLAEGVLKHQLMLAGLRRCVAVDSAGTYCSQPGHKPDIRSVAIAKREGIKLRGIKARRVSSDDFEKYDLILVMDKDNQEALLEQCPSDRQHKIQLLMQYADNADNADEVPDPYYGSQLGFERAFQMIADAIEGLLAHLESNLATK